MAKSLCILHSNCQGEALQPLLESSAEFSKKFEIRQYLNYRQQAMADADLERCGLFLYQYLAPKWGEFSSEQLLARLPGAATSICLPNFFFNGYWPSWTNKTQAIEFADSALETLIARGLDQTSILYLYLKGSPALFGDVEKIAEDSISRERIKEEHSPIKYVDIIAENWRKEQLFHTINHPGKRLLFHMANGLLRLLGFRKLERPAERSYVHPQGDFWLPIHPVIGQRLGLPFAGKDRKYPCFGGEITHGEFINSYLACRALGIKDLTGVLKGTASISTT